MAVPVAWPWSTRSPLFHSLYEFLVSPSMFSDHGNYFDYSIKFCYIKTSTSHLLGVFFFPFMPTINLCLMFPFLSEFCCLITIHMIYIYTALNAYLVRYIVYGTLRGKSSTNLQHRKTRQTPKNTECFNVPNKGFGL